MNRRYIDFVPVKKADTVERILPTVKAKSTTTKTKTTTMVYASPRPVAAPSPKPNPELQSLKGVKLSSPKHIYAAPKKPQTTFSATKEQKSTMNIPQTTFINQEKVVKRPLSKNVYIRELEKKTAEEPQKSPEDSKIIISEPKKKSKAGVIIAIIVTIVLGALAGTAAFFLLPK